VGNSFCREEKSSSDGGEEIEIWLRRVPNFKTSHEDDRPAVDEAAVEVTVQDKSDGGNEPVVALINRLTV
jgi:hypothetical protein